MIESVLGSRWQHAAALLACKACKIEDTHRVLAPVPCKMFHPEACVREVVHLGMVVGNAKVDSQRRQLLHARRRSVLLRPKARGFSQASPLQPKCMHRDRHLSFRNFDLNCSHSAPLGRDETVRCVSCTAVSESRQPASQPPRPRRPDACVCLGTIARVTQRAAWNEDNAQNSAILRLKIALF